MKLLDILEEKIDKIFNPKEEIKKSKVDLNEKLPKQPMLLSYGSNWNNEPLCVLGEGDISIITGKAGSKKSFFRTMLVASYISGYETDDRMPFRTHRKDNLMVIDIDTEQSPFMSQRAFKRINTIAGEYPNYEAHRLKPYTAKERLMMIEEIVEKYKDKIGLLSIDGLVDLVESFNDEIESRLLLEKFMRWTNDYKIHIMGILHQNPSSSKMMGHIGSIITRKAATVFTVVKNEESGTSTVWNTKARDEEIDPFEIEINMGLPYKV